MEENKFLYIYWIVENENNIYIYIYIDVSWVIRVEEHFPLVEFAYKNSYQASIQMAPYEALYWRPCRSPLCWTEMGESYITGPDLIRDTSEKVSLIR